MDPFICEKSDITSLEETKLYTAYANGLLEALVKAVQAKNLKPISALVWITLKMEVHLRSDDWSTKKSISEFMSQFGIARSTAQAVVKELCAHGFLIKELNKRDDNSNDAMTLKVRFPQAGVALAEMDPDRKKKGGSNNISTEVGRISAQGYADIQHSIKNTRKQLLEKNKGDELSPDSPQDRITEASPTESIVDCCLASPTDNPKDFGDSYEPDPLAEEANKLESEQKELKKKLVNLQNKLEELKTSYKQDPGNLDIYREKEACESALTRAERKLESISNGKSSTQATSAKHKSGGEGSAKPAKGKNTPFVPRDKPIELPEYINRHIDESLKRVRKTHGISGVETYAERIKLMLMRFKFGNDLKHAANILIKKLKQGEEIKPPGGCSDIAAINRREKESAAAKINLSKIAANNEASGVAALLRANSSGSQVVSCMH